MSPLSPSVPLQRDPLALRPGIQFFSVTFFQMHPCSSFIEADFTKGLRQREDPRRSYTVSKSLVSIKPSMDFPGGPDCKGSACNTGDLSSTPGSGRSPGEGNGNSLQYSCLENPMDRGAWWVTVHGVTKNQTQLSD